MIYMIKKNRIFQIVAPTKVAYWYTKTPNSYVNFYNCWIFAPVWLVQTDILSYKALTWVLKFADAESAWFNSVFNLI
jgi:hypothetical protein